MNMQSKKTLTAFALAMAVVAMGACLTAPATPCGDGLCGTEYQCKEIEGVPQCVAKYACGDAAVSTEEAGEVCDTANPYSTSCVQLGSISDGPGALRHVTHSCRIAAACSTGGPWNRRHP